MAGGRRSKATPLASRKNSSTSQYSGDLISTGEGSRNKKDTANSGSSGGREEHDQEITLQATATASAGEIVAASFSKKTLRSMSFAEVLFILVGAFSVLLISFSIAMAAELAITIHYFEKPTVPSFDALDQRERELTAHHRATSADPEISSIRAQQEGVGRLARVIQRSADPSDHPRYIMIVEEQATTIGSKESGTNTTTARTADLSPPSVDYYKLATVRPSLCRDHHSVGFDSWKTLQDAVREANSLSVERFVRWSRYFAEAVDFAGVFEDDSMYYEEDILLPICPGSRLRARRGPIFINAPNLIITCDGCEVAVGGSHLSFGPHAKNVLIRGVTFRGATESSLVFFQHGSHVTFEDCAWFDNAAISDRFGAVADVNSTSVVNFSRCHIGKSQRGEPPGLVSSLSVRA
jgi:hypothetical protein